MIEKKLSFDQYLNILHNSENANSKEAQEAFNNLHLYIMSNQNADEVLGYQDEILDRLYLNKNPEIQTKLNLLQDFCENSMLRIMHGSDMAKRKEIIKTVDSDLTVQEDILQEATEQNAQDVIDVCQIYLPKKEHLSMRLHKFQKNTLIKKQKQESEQDHNL